MKRNHLVLFFAFLALLGVAYLTSSSWRGNLLDASIVPEVRQAPEPIATASTPSPTPVVKEDFDDNVERPYYANFKTTTEVIPLGLQIVKEYPHNILSFTQGLEFDSEGQLYEGTGLNHRSKLMKINIADGKELQSASLPGQYFGEGITIFKDKIYQLTWQEATGFIYSKQNLDKIGSWTYTLRKEGWGLTHNEEYLISSYGGSSLDFLDPENPADVKKTITVKMNGKEVKRLNEIEWIHGHIWANIWYSDTIVVINPETGVVVAALDCSSLHKERSKEEDVLNGIAFNPKTGTIFVTGKLWKKMFEIKVFAKN